VRERWVTPVASYTLSAGFGETGSLWVSGHHTGQDFVAAYGTAVRAAHAGEVVFAGWGERYGNLVEIAHRDGTQTWYAHLSAITRSSGWVRTGETIGAVGCSGNCLGTHLHFEVRLGPETPVDPLVWLRLRGVAV
jgi:murein DD-endopeptidase MepM/ murein hydrolase activator NlpD